MTRSPWLRRQLLLKLALPVTFWVIVTGTLGAWGAHRLVERVYDGWLLDAASSLASQVHFNNGRAVVELTDQSRAILTYDDTDRSFFEVTQAEIHVLGQPAIPTRGTDLVEYPHGRAAYDGEIGGAQVRIAEVQVQGPHGESAQVRVAETLLKRQRSGRDLMLMLAPMAGLVLIAAVITGVTVQRTVLSLEQIASRWGERSHRSLEPIPDADLPKELMPFGVALNDLLARIRQMLDQERHFAAAAAHQLRTPLSGLQLGLDRASKQPDLQSTRQVLAELGARTQKMSRLIQQLLALSRLTPELSAASEMRVVDLVELTRDTAEPYVDSALAKGVEITFEYRREAPIWIRADQELLAEAIGNMVDNAVRYTPVRGQIRVTVADHPPRLIVEDSGPGIEPIERARVFERFVRGKDATGDGTGLGLSILRDILALHKANVCLDASPLGGARFLVQFSHPEG